MPPVAAAAWARGLFPGPTTVRTGGRKELLRAVSGPAFDRCGCFVASLDAGVDQAGCCRLAFQDHTRVVSLDGDAYCGSTGVIGYAVGVFRLGVGAVGALPEFHFLYLSQLRAEACGAGAKRTRRFNDEGDEVVLGEDQIPVFGPLSRFPILSRSTRASSQKMWLVGEGQGLVMATSTSMCFSSVQL